MKARTWQSMAYRLHSSGFGWGYRKVHAMMVTLFILLHWMYSAIAMLHENNIVVLSIYSPGCRTAKLDWSIIYIAWGPRPGATSKVQILSNPPPCDWTFAEKKSRSSKIASNRCCEMICYWASLMSYLLIVCFLFITISVVHNGKVGFSCYVRSDILCELNGWSSGRTQAAWSLSSMIFGRFNISIESIRLFFKIFIVRTVAEEGMIQQLDLARSMP